MSVWCISRSLLQKKEPHIQLLGVQLWMQKTLDVTDKIQMSQSSDPKLLTASFALVEAH